MLLGAFLPAQSFHAPAAKAATPPLPIYYKAPRLQKVYFTAFNDPTSEFSALQGGSLDAMEWPLTQSQLTTVQGNNKYQANLSNDLGSVQVVFDAGRFPSNDTAFRQALSLMIDRQDVVTTSLQGLGGKMPDQLTPSWPSGYHVPGGFNWDLNLAQANATLFAGGFRYTGGSGGHWYNIVNATNQVNPATTIFYSRSDDPHRLYIGIQVATMQGATKSTYHFDRLFTVNPVTSYVTTRTAYKAATSSGGYNSNNCNGTGFPCFTAYTQGLSFGIPDPAYLFFSFGPVYLDVPYQNFGHWDNSTIFTDVTTMYNNPTISNAQVQTVNKEVTQQAFWDPIYYQQDWNGISTRVTGHDSAQNSAIPDGSFFFNNQYSYWRSHLKGRLYGGSLRIGIYNPQTQYNIFNQDSNWVYDAIVYNRIYDSLLNFNYDTGLWMAGLATDYSVSTFTAPIYSSKFQSGTPSWATTSAAPYWAHNTTTTHIVSGEKISFTLLTNATWHDGSTITPNDVIWNTVVDAMDANNLLTTPYSTLDDVNATGNTVNLYFNSTGFDLLTGTALNPVAPPLPWIHHSTTWVGTAGALSTISLASKASLNLSAAGGLNLLDGSGSMKFDTATTGDPFTVGSTFDLVANNNWYYRDPNQATYATGIADLTAYPSTPISIGTTIPVSIALVNGNNAKGDVFSGGNFVTDPTTTSDTTTGATVTAIVYENPSDTVTLTLSSGLYSGALPTTGLLAGKTYHVQITATKAGSIPTTYGPAGSSAASAVGISWEGDPVNTAFTTMTATPVFSPFLLFAGLVTVLAAVPIAKRARQIKI
jgi:hypothetical protein